MEQLRQELMNLDDEGAKKRFIEEIGSQADGAALYRATMDGFDAEEAREVLAEMAATINAACSADDFHNWNYDHVEFIIQCSKKPGFTVPRNLLNGLPEQLIILVDKDRLAEPGCS
jgi:hypothetical protein